MKTQAARMSDWFDGWGGEIVGGALHVILLLGSLPVDFVLILVGLPAFIVVEKTDDR